MTNLNVKANTDRQFRLLFHLVFWTVWVGFPVISSGGNERFLRYYFALLPVMIIYIPLFLINSDWLIPNIFRKRGISIYLLMLLGLIALFSLIHLTLKAWLIPEELMPRRWDIFWSIAPVSFLTAISTGYGFITYLLKQEKIYQEEQKERLQSELAFLRSQISPHFIFNVLNSIVYLIRTRSELAEKVTIKLSELMRYMLYTSKESQTSLNKELEYLENYVEIQKIRFEEDVDIKFQLTGTADATTIEPMLMIPFVENAFKHGVGLIDHPVIDIAVALRGDSMTFIVKNKISPDSGGEKDPSSGIGLTNVRRRLELLYEDNHQLRIEQENGWFIVTLELTFAKQNTD